ncbi:COG4315 family predicted lipoprotein [Runella sp.]|uniref:COG4315 family predicted lipoprotein n=1 Tax=Runella sp. TaxID=1960881 RepID=UPI003D128B39
MKINKLPQLVVGYCLMALLVGCKTEDAAPVYDVSLQETSLGKVLTNDAGKTLYVFTKDVNGTSVCTGGCKDTWPVFFKETLKLDPTLNAADFGTITRDDGAKQTTYQGWPLYAYKSDAVAGDVKGENVGGVWIAAKTTYTVMLANAQLKGHDGKLYTAEYKEGTADTQFFVDGKGRTLYAFANDKKGKNNFTKADFSNNSVWPIFEAELKDIPSTLDKTLFSAIKVGDKTQLVYKGWPLYYFGQDDGVRGATKGVSFPRPGVWPIVQKTTATAPD